MTDELNRRDWLKVTGAAAAASVVPPSLTPDTPLVPTDPFLPPPPLSDGEVVALTSTSDVFCPPRGGARMKFSFDFPEPSVKFGEHRFGFLVFTNENTYAPDIAG